MHSWKLLGDLLPGELRLECERAGLKAVEKDSHNFVKLAKYILSNGFDPEMFYFNTLYQADKSNPLLGMMSNSGAKHPPAGVAASGLSAVPGVSSVFGSSCHLLLIIHQKHCLLCSLRCPRIFRKWSPYWK